MLTLVINTATKQNELLLVSEQKILRQNSWLSRRDESEKLLPKIQTLIFSAKKQFAQLNKIFVVTGPGGFTSLRVGITIANTLAYALSIPIVGCTLEQWWDVQAVDGTGRAVRDYLILHSATPRELFILGHGRFAENYPELQMHTFDQLTRFIKKQREVFVIGELLDTQQQELIHLGVEFLTADKQRLIDLINQSRGGKNIVVEPFYGRVGQTGKSKRMTSRQ